MSMDSRRTQYVVWNMEQGLSDAEKAQARNNIGAAALASLAPAFSTSTDYTEGDVVTYNDGKLYVFTADKAAGVWDGTKVNETTIWEVLQMAAEKPTTIVSAQMYMGALDYNLYTYANNNHSNTIAFTTSCDLAFRKNAGSCTTTDGTNALPMVTFSRAKKLKIKRARITTQGSPGIGAANGKKAAQLFIKGVWIGPPAVASGNYISLAIDNYNEWQDINETYDVNADGNFSAPEFFLEIVTQLNGVASQLTIDDYNLQKAYEGQKLQMWLELEVEADGVSEYVSE